MGISLQQTGIHLLLAHTFEWLLALVVTASSVTSPS